MRLKRFEGKTLKEAFENVKRDLGPDALILSSRTFRKDNRIMGLLGGRRVEVLAALDPPPAKAAAENPEPQGRGPQSVPEKDAPAGFVAGTGFPLPAMDPFEPDCALLKDVGFHPDLQSMHRNMVCRGLHASVAFRLLWDVHQKAASTHSIGAELLAALERQVRCVNPDESGARVIAMLGPTGVGKTTTMAKLAARDRLGRKMRVALVTLDTYRIAAVEQIRVYADIIGVPMRTVRRGEDLPRVLAETDDYDRVYVDTPGRAPGDDDAMAEFDRCFRTCEQVHPMLLVSATTSERDAGYVLERFRRLSPKSLAITKVDECVLFGPVLNFLARSDMSVSYVTNGQKVPDDIEVATPRVLIEHLLSKKPTDSSRSWIRQAS